MSKEGIEESNLVSFHLTYSLDGHFFRRECSRCGLEFKTRATPDQLTHMLSPEVERIYSEAAGVDIETSIDEQEKLTCPYCENTDETQEFISGEFRNYFLRLANREIVYPIIKEFQDSLSDIFGKSSRGSSRGLISITMEYSPGDNYLPIRPIAGPEVSDMRVIRLLCCGEEVKIHENWVNSIVCPHCSEYVVLT